jgi:class 3 adenylate cyclase/predicted ATPase
VSQPDSTEGVDELLDRAIHAIRIGDRAAAHVLAEQVLALDRHNADAEDLLLAPTDHGEIRRLTIMFADLVDSTALSMRTEPEVYRTVVGRYRDDVLKVVRQYGGHIGSTKGDGLLAFFGHPEAHEDDGRRAVQAGLDITREVAALSGRVRRRFGFDINVRVGIHHGIVYLDTAQDDVYGLAANLAARMCGLAEPGTVAVSAAMEVLIRDTFELQGRPPALVKGVDEPVRYYIVVAERDLTPHTRGPLVGRVQESAYLERSWARAQAGVLDLPGMAFVGDAGIGKSRLAWSAVALAERSHSVVLQLVGSPFHTDVGLRPIRRLLERRCEIGRTSDPAERLRRLEREILGLGSDPATMMPLLAPVLGIAPQAGYQPVHAEGYKLYELIATAVQAYLLACVRDGPALVLVEDMHWFDVDTVEVVQSLLAADTGGHVLVAMTSRDLADVPDSTRTKIFELKPLSSAEVAKLITTLHPEATPKQQQAVQVRCDGVPLYVEELVAKIKDQPTDEAYSVGVPDTLYEALFARLRSTSGTARVVETAAIIGSRVERSLLLSTIDLTERQVDEAIAQLVESRVLEPLEVASWRFRHELLREVAAELSPPSLRRRLHSRIADALASAIVKGNPDWPLIARHYERAERYAEAASAYGQASANAGQRGALGEARTYLTHAVTQVERAAPSQDRDQLEIGLRLRRAFLVQAAEGVSSPNVAADFERCLQLCSSDLRDDDLLSTVMSLYPYYTMKADLDRAQRLVESIRTSLTGSRASFLPINDFALGMLAWYRGEFDYARTKLDAAANALTSAASDELDAILFMPNHATAGLYTHLALSRLTDGELTAADSELARAERLCGELAFPKGAFSLAYARQTEVLIRIEAGQLDRASAAAGEVATLGEEHGFDSFAMFGTAQYAVVCAVSWLADDDRDDGALATHINTVATYVEAFRELGMNILVTFYDAVLARLLTAAGRPEEARARLQTALELAAQTGMHFYDAELLRLRAHTTEDVELRRADLDSAIRLARSQGAKAFELRSAAETFEMIGERSRQTLVDALDRFPADSTWPELTLARTLLG